MYCIYYCAVFTLLCFARVMILWRNQTVQSTNKSIADVSNIKIIKFLCYLYYIFHLKTTASYLYAWKTDISQRIYYEIFTLKSMFLSHFPLGRGFDFKWVIVVVITYMSIPANTKRNKNVIITSKRRFDVIITCSLRCVFAGITMS